MLLMPVSQLHQWMPATYLATYTVQCSLVAWLLWRYRRQLPELTAAFHWAAVPVGGAVAFAWIGMGLWMVHTFPDRFALQSTTDDMFAQMGLGLGWSAFLLRLVGMSVLVPLFEELFVRSLLLRGFSNANTTLLGLTQIVMDMPVIGEWLTHTRVGHWADHHRPVVFAQVFDRTPLGTLTLFGVAASTVVFTVGHGVRDWPAAVVCGIAYCLLLAATRHKGLGPVCWAHGITNAILWGYTLQTNDWQFL